MANHRDLTPDWSVEDVKALFLQPTGPWPRGWEGFPNVVKAFQELYAQAALDAPTEHYEPWVHPRGIVICGGGWRFFPSIYVTVRAIRHTGCKLPIQVWYLGRHGEFDARMAWALDPYGVGWIDAQAYAAEKGIPKRIWGGWEVKPFAALHAPFREVVCLDADSYPAYDPEVFLDSPEYARVGAAFWPDQNQLEPGQWERFGLPHHVEPSFESGQYCVDKSRHYKPLALSCWMNDFSDYVYKHIYGDKDTFHLSWRKVGHECCIPTAVPGWHKVAFLQKDFAGKPLFCHRTRDKFRWGGHMDGAPVPSAYMTAQWHSGTQYIEGLPHERNAHIWCKESSEVLRPDQHFKFPDGVGNGWGRALWDEVFTRNEYALPDVLPGDAVVLDIGAHAGAFTRACFRRGAGRAVCVEPDPRNVPCLEHNLGDHGADVTLAEAAVWWGHGEVVLTEDPIHVPGNTSCVSATRPGEGLTVPSVPLDDMIRLAADTSTSGRVSIMKMDCEGGEYPGLLGSTLLGLVDSICGESHEGVTIDGKAYTVRDVVEVLQREGFQTRTFANGPSTHLFWAWRGQDDPWGRRCV